MAWNIELSPAAVAALRDLPREEQEYVARRIRHLEDAGPPRETEGVCAVPAGDQTLMCVADREGNRIVVVTLLSAEAAASGSVGQLIRTRVRQWITNVMGGGGMGGVLSDLRFAVRGLRRSPGFTVAAVLTLALGIGATAAIFSVANGVLLRPLPYGDADGVVTIWSSWSNFPDKTWVSESEYRYYYQENRTLDGVALYQTFNVNFTSPENPERVGAAAITPNTLSVLRVDPVLGRTFTWDEAQLQDSVVMLGYGVWQRRFGGDPEIVGTDVLVNGRSRTVVGIIPEGFVLPVDYGSASVSEVFYPYSIDVETPVQMPQGGGSHGSYMVARLRSGETAETALADLTGLIGRLEAVGTYSAERAFHPRVYPVKEDIVGTARGTILVLLGAVAFVLLIACGNVANLLLSRSEGRIREVAVRTALGAGRARIFRQLLTENLLLAGLGGVLGLGVAWVGVDALLTMDPDAVPRAGSVQVNGTVIAFTAGVSVLTAILFGVMPAWRVSRGRVGLSLHANSRGAGSKARSNRTQGLLVASQMAMVVILLTGSGLMIKTFIELLRIDPGFRAQNVLTLRITTPGSAYPDAPAVAGFYEELLRRVREVPGVRTAGAARILPLATTMGDAGFRPVWYQSAPNESTQADWQWATPGYFESMGIPLLKGRVFDGRDVVGGQSVVLVNESLARRYWGADDPVGSAVLAMGGDTAVVIGVVGDIRHNGIVADVKDRFYRPHAQVTRSLGSMRSMTLTIAGHGDARGLIEPIRRQIRTLDPSMPINEVATMDEVLSATVAQPRFAMVLLVAFAALALTLAVVGIYGVLAYAVSQRTQEIGVRLALGADTGQVVRMVVRQGMFMALTGVAVGTAVAWFASDLIAGMLYRVTPQDLTTFLAVPLVFSAVALLACWLPAARAARVRPAQALRYE